MTIKKTTQTNKNKGSIVTKNGKIFARIRFTDDFGKKRDLWRTATDKKDAQSKLKELIELSETRTAKEIDAVRMTLNDLIDFYESTYLHEPVYSNGRKISGLRGVPQYTSLLKQIRREFGTRRIEAITHAELLRYKIKRLNTPTKDNRQRGIADVNHAMQMLRRLFSIAVREGWLNKSPFQKGDSLISLADAPQRTRIISFEEETRLLAAIDSHPSRKHLKGIVLIGLDMAFRAGEIKTLKKSDIDFSARTITIRAFNSKTARSRTVAMTNRVYEWLWGWCKNLQDEERPFPIRTFQRTWWNVLKQARIDDLHFHDTRATAISRMIAAGLPHAEVMRVSGHLTLACVFRYIRSDDSLIHRAASVLDAYLTSNTITNEHFEATM